MPLHRLAVLFLLPGVSIFCCQPCCIRDTRVPACTFWEVCQQQQTRDLCFFADGGNIEGTQTQIIDQAYNTTANCLKPPSSAPPLCATLQVCPLSTETYLQCLCGVGLKYQPPANLKLDNSTDPAQ